MFILTILRSTASCLQHRFFSLQLCIVIYLVVESEQKLVRRSVNVAVIIWQRRLGQPIPPFSTARSKKHTAISVFLPDPHNKERLRLFYSASTRLRIRWWRAICNSFGITKLFIVIAFALSDIHRLRKRCDSLTALTIISSLFCSHENGSPLNVPKILRVSTNLLHSSFLSKRLCLR